jgi:hypothetical protein
VLAAMFDRRYFAGFQLLISCAVSSQPLERETAPAHAGNAGTVDGGRLGGTGRRLQRSNQNSWIPSRVISQCAVVSPFKV